ncbi:hypothetical protein C8046_01190 [Serinibacter arcticus]|uniref:Uncharacterized protein n=1 Tax=Serinibacter arcticus TaxID=1655435 RepID=A0A2U1ZRB6_9MICO|nr:hypothetical protein [Serinibacter arcticus]PWD49534.1 hypothetical protein C8046_01190 [Serinibacter arcticus]
MGIFSRRRQPQDSAPDLAGLVAAALTRRGLPFTQLNAGEFAVGSQTLYLENLARMTRDLAPADLEREVERWVGVMTAEKQQGPETLEDVRQAIFPRILHREMFAAAEAAAEQAARAARVLTPDLYLLPAIDRPDTVETVLHPETYGGWEAIWPVAVANLRSLPRPDHRRIEAGPGQEGVGTVHLFETEDFFGATRLLVVEEVLAQALGEPVDASHGLLVAMPGRQSLGVHVLGPDPVAMNNAIRTLVNLARADLPGALIDQVHYRSPDGTLQRISRTTDEGGAAVLVKGAFADALGRLGLTG